MLEKLGALDGVEGRLREIGDKLDRQSSRLDQMEVKVDMSMEKLGNIEVEQYDAARADLRCTVPYTEAEPPDLSSIMGTRPSTAPVAFVPVTATAAFVPEIGRAHV